MKLLVTGGAGFIGSAFVRGIVRHEAQSAWEAITVLDSLTYAGNLRNLEGLGEDPRFQFVLGDVRDRPLVEALVAQNDRIVHFAAESHVDRSLVGPNEFFDTNIWGTINILDAMLGNSSKRMIYVSTDEVYGSKQFGSSVETDLLSPSSPYSSSKASADLICLAYSRSYGVDVMVTRCCNNYGPFQFPEKLIPLFITNLIDDRKVPIYGNGLNVREWIHVDDHCRALRMVLSAGKSGEVYNVGGTVEISNIDVTLRLLELLDKSEDLLDFVEDRAGHDFRYSINSKKILDEVGFSCNIDFNEGLKDTLKWYIQNESWWRPLKSL